MKTFYTIIAMCVLAAGQLLAQTDGLGVDVADPQEKLDVNGAVRIGTTTNTNTGTIRWNGTDFEGYNGTEWVSLTQYKNADAWSATSTGGVFSTSWTTINGMSVTFTLTDSATIHMDANGSIRQSTATLCHQSFRFVIDGVGQGDASAGQIIHQIHGENWNGWSFGYSTVLAPGSHTILVQTRESQGGSPNCWVCAELTGTPTDYTQGNLRVQAFYK